MAATHCSQVHAAQVGETPGQALAQMWARGPFGISFCQRVEQEGGEEAEDGGLGPTPVGQPEASAGCSAGARGAGEELPS